MADTTESLWRGRSGAGEVGIGRSRDDGVAPRWCQLHQAVVPALAVRHVHLQTRFDRPECARDCGLFRGSYEPGGPGGFHASDAADATFTVVQVNGGGYDLSHPHIEANLDIQYAEAMRYPIPHIFYNTGQGLSGTEDWFVSWLEYILGQPKIPQTISISYGVDEEVPSREYAMYVCDRSSVRVGSASSSRLATQGNCKTNDGSVRFIPSFPATCMCGVFLPLGVVHKCGSRTRATSPRLGRSLGHRRWRNDGLRSGGRSEFLWRRLLGYFERPSY